VAHFDFAFAGFGFVVWVVRSVTWFVEGRCSLLLGGRCGEFWRKPSQLAAAGGAVIDVTTVRHQLQMQRPFMKCQPITEAIIRQTRPTLKCEPSVLGQHPPFAELDSF